MLDAVTSHASLATLVAVFAFLGLLVGSFVNVVVLRLPRMLQRQWDAEVAEQLNSPLPDQLRFDLAQPSSHCPHCLTPLKWFELLPLLSFVALGARCRTCAAPVAWRYPLVELAVAVWWGLCAWQFGASASTLVWAGFGTALLALAMIDLDTMLLPDAITLPLLWAGLMAASLGWTQVALPDALWGAVAGYASLWTVHRVFWLMTGKHGMGAGDFKLLAALGAWLGWTALPATVLLASVIGLLGAGYLLMRGRYQADQPLPFGPSLAMSGAAVAALVAVGVQPLDWLAL